VRKKRKKKKKEEETTGRKMTCAVPYGGHNKIKRLQYDKNYGLL